MLRKRKNSQKHKKAVNANVKVERLKVGYETGTKHGCGRQGNRNQGEMSGENAVEMFDCIFMRPAPPNTKTHTHTHTRGRAKAYFHSFTFSERRPRLVQHWCYCGETHTF